mmetsp:Transcript_51158/g.121585  ORF Transcript_51158/g.121585 Transcript_51158/m.121585 type:complete len:108 (-) Transcript_51158:56-379(-)
MSTLMLIGTSGSAGAGLEVEKNRRAIRRLRFTLLPRPATTAANPTEIDVFAALCQPALPIALGKRLAAVVYWRPVGAPTGVFAGKPRKATKGMPCDPLSSLPRIATV